MRSGEATREHQQPVVPRHAGDGELRVSGRGRGIQLIDLASVFASPEERSMLSLISDFDLSRNEIQLLTGLDALTSLRRLEASYNHITKVTQLPLRLTQLHLAHNKLRSLDGIAQLPHLQELDVSANRLTSLAGLRPKGPLRILRADDNRLTTTMGLEDQEHLQFCSLQHNFVESLDDLLFLRSTPALEVLHLSGNPVTTVATYRRACGQLHRSLLALDGAPLLRDEEVMLDGRKTDVDGPMPRHWAPTAASRREPTTSSRVPTASSIQAEIGGRNGDGRGWAPEGAIQTPLPKRSDSGDCSEEPPRKTRLAATPESIERSAQTVHHSDCDGVTPPQQRGATISARGSTASASATPRVMTAPMRSSQTPRQRRSLLSTPRSHSPIINSYAEHYQHTRDGQTATMEDETLSRTPRQSSFAHPQQSAPSNGAETPISACARRLPFAQTSPNTSTATVGASVLTSSAKSAAVLHDSLVLQEQLQAENRMLRARLKKTESEMGELRRVVSEQLRDLSAARLERDSARSTEEDLRAQVERAKRSVKAAGVHQRAEVRTLEEQYARTKTFMEAQIADLRQQLLEERQKGRRRATERSSELPPRQPSPHSPPNPSPPACCHVSEPKTEDDNPGDNSPHTPTRQPSLEQRLEGRGELWDMTPISQLTVPDESPHMDEEHQKETVNLSAASASGSSASEGVSAQSPPQPILSAASLRPPRHDADRAVMENDTPAAGDPCVDSAKLLMQQVAHLFASAPVVAAEGSSATS